MLVRSTDSEAIILIISARSSRPRTDSPSWSSSANPTSAVSGVRSSWEIEVMSSSFERIVCSSRT